MTPSVRQNPVYLFVKRVFDILFSILILLLSSPLFAVFMVLIWKEDGGDPIFRQERIGKSGKKIRIYKFRSMKVNADRLEEMLSPEQYAQYQREFKLENDPRVTRIGDFLRKSSLDELPQLVNIIKGELSMVGPRPVVEDELRQYNDEERSRFLSVKPGLTGYWQAYARNNASYETGERQKMELYYVEHAGIWFDIRILFRTVYAVIKRQGVK